MAALHVLAIMAAASSQGSNLSLGPYEPAHGCYIGAYIELDPTVKGDVEAFENLTGKKHCSYFRYVGYGQPFPFAWVKELKARGQVPHIAWEPNQGLDAVQDDEYLRGWAEAARRADVPIFLRFASEMNGNWQAWSGNPALYVEKWRLVYRVMHQIAPKVVMVWCPFAVPQGSITSYYPGDEYVDWVGVNIYSVKRHDGDPKKIAGEDPTDLLRYVYKLYASRKPIAICEYAATHYCNALKLRCPEFAVEKMRQLYSALPTEFPRVRMINWFSVNAASDNLADNDYSVTTDPQVLAAYREIISSDYFLSELQGAPVVQIAAAPGPPEAAPEAPGEAAQPQPATSVARPQPATSAALAGDRPATGSLTGIYIAILGAPPAAVRGRVQILVQLPDALIGGMVKVYLDGRVKGLSNAPPFTFTVNADALDPGEHKIRVEVTDSSDVVRQEAEAAFIVAPPTG